VLNKGIKQSFFRKLRADSDMDSQHLDLISRKSQLVVEGKCFSPNLWTTRRV